jgi:hypothetical protein
MNAIYDINHFNFIDRIIKKTRNVRYHKQKP